MKVVVAFEKPIVYVDVGDNVENEGYDDSLESPESGLDVELLRTMSASDAVADARQLLSKKMMMEMIMLVGMLQMLVSERERALQSEK